MQYMRENCLSGFTSVPHRSINALVRGYSNSKERDENEKELGSRQ